MKKLLSLLLCLSLVGCGSSKTETKKDTETKEVSYVGTIVIDAGHQEKQNTELEPIGPGAKEKKAKVAAGTTGVSTKKPEYEVTLEVAKKLQKVLKERNYKVIMVRTKHDVNISNKERAEIANKANADAFIRLHCNGASDSSIQGALAVAPTDKNTYLEKKIISASQKLSNNVIEGLCEETGANNRGVQLSDTMSGINWCTVPVTIVEMGFMSNKEEDEKLSDSTYQDKLAKGMADGLDNYMENK